MIPSNPAKQFYLKCDEATFSLPLHSLLKHPESLLTKMLLESGQGINNAVFFDQDATVLRYVVLATKFPGSVDWRDLNRTQLKLALRCCQQLRLRPIFEEILDVLNLRIQVGNDIRSTIELALEEKFKDSDKKAAKLSEFERSLVGVAYSCATWFFDDELPIRTNLDPKAEGEAGDSRAASDEIELKTVVVPRLIPDEKTKIEPSSLSQDINNHKEIKDKASEIKQPQDNEDNDEDDDDDSSCHDEDCEECGKNRKKPQAEPDPEPVQALSLTEMLSRARAKKSQANFKSGPIQGQSQGPISGCMPIPIVDKVNVEAKNKTLGKGNDAKSEADSKSTVSKKKN